jgi:hypothetical protein
MENADRTPQTAEAPVNDAAKAERAAAAAVANYLLSVRAR